MLATWAATNKIYVGSSAQTFYAPPTCLDEDLTAYTPGHPNYRVWDFMITLENWMSERGLFLGCLDQHHFVVCPSAARSSC